MTRTTISHVCAMLVFKHSLGGTAILALHVGVGSKDMSLSPGPAL